MLHKCATTNTGNVALGSPQLCWTLDSQVNVDALQRRGTAARQSRQPLGGRLWRWLEPVDTTGKKRPLRM